MQPKQNKPSGLPSVGLVLLLLLPSCLANPDKDDRSALAGAQRVLALDFGRSAANRRMGTVGKLPGLAGAEMKRARDLLTLGPRTPIRQSVSSELKRTRTLSSRATGVFAEEWQRRPHWPAGVVPTAFQFSRNTANNLDSAAMLLGFDHRPLGEISDKRHRTDHRDVRPEATFWQRLRRRLPF